MVENRICVDTYYIPVIFFDLFDDFENYWGFVISYSTPKKASTRYNLPPEITIKVKNSK